MPAREGDQGNVRAQDYPRRVLTGLAEQLEGGKAADESKDK